MTDFKRFQTECHRWSEQTFGIGRSPDGPIAHLVKEVEELQKQPYDLMEYADCLMLILDAASNADIPADILLEAAWDKLEINRHRDWGKPDENGVVEHVRDGN